MSFYPQSTKYQCGPFALKYALVMLGICQNEKDISRVSGCSWYNGTDEVGLSKAAKTYDCRLKYFTTGEKVEAIKHLNKYLKKGIPAILCVDNWGHWLTVLGIDKEKYIVVDSDIERVFVIYTKNQLLRRWQYKDEESSIISYDGYALYTNTKPLTKANFSLDKARFVMRASNKELAANWDSYFNDLILICKPKSHHQRNIISFAEFLRRNQNLIVKETSNWHGMPPYKELRKILKNMRFIAEVYGLVIPETEQKKALIDVSCILMMYACGKYGIKPIYTT